MHKIEFKHFAITKIAALLCNRRMTKFWLFTYIHDFYSSILSIGFVSLLIVSTLAAAQDTQKRNSLLSKQAGRKNIFQKTTTTTEAPAYEAWNQHFMIINKKKFIRDIIFVGWRSRICWWRGWIWRERTGKLNDHNDDDRSTKENDSTKCSSHALKRGFAFRIKETSIKWKE